MSEEQKKPESTGNDLLAGIGGFALFAQLCLLLYKGAYPRDVDWFVTLIPVWLLGFAVVSGVIGHRLYLWLESMEKKPEPFEEIKGENSTVPFTEKRNVG